MTNAPRVQEAPDPLSFETAPKSAVFQNIVEPSHISKPIY